MRAIGQMLATRFPALFGGPARPLKLRIQADIQQRAPGVFTREQLSAFLRRHTGQTAYLSAMARGGQRFDLDGAPAGEIAAEHREAAATEVQRRRANQQARFEQEREALRQQREAVRQEREALRREQGALRREQQAARRGQDPARREPDPNRSGQDPARRAQDPARRAQGPARREQDPTGRGQHAAQREPGPARREPDPAQREQDQAMRRRASLLHDYENTRLSAANFCVLKGIDPTQLEALLAQARQEAGQRAAAGRPDRGPGDSRPRADRADRAGPRRDGRPPQRDQRPPGAGPRPPRKPSSESR
ncbi:MAG: hypothetical protein KGQ67_14865 [Betaproteobacteria bacterium]|nr:hypothetical protein [Betaproteobacteria bacterium]